MIEEEIDNKIEEKLKKKTIYLCINKVNVVNYGDT